MSSWTGRGIRNMWYPKIYCESTKTIGLCGQMGRGVPSRDKAQANLLALSVDSPGDLAGLAVPGSGALHCVCVLFHLAKDHRLTIQPLGLGSPDEKLGNICVGPSIDHGPDARTRVLWVKNSHHQTSPCGWTCPQYLHGMGRHCPGTEICESFWESRSQTLPPQSSEHPSLLLSWELCLQTTGRRCCPVAQEYGGIDHGWAVRGGSGWRGQHLQSFLSCSRNSVGSAFSPPRCQRTPWSGALLCLTWMITTGS